MRFDPYSQYDDENPFPWWAKVLVVVAVACVGALVQRCQVGHW